MACDGRQTLLQRIVEALPENLKEAYASASRKGSEAHEILRLLAAQHLWKNGFRDISFEKTVNGYNGQNMCVDIYEGSQGLFIECERHPDREDVLKRRQRIRGAHPYAKFILATQDRMGWKAKRLLDAADEVWVVSKDGQVKTPQAWVEERKRQLQSIINVVEMQGLINAYKKAEEEYRKLVKLEEEEEVYWQLQLTGASLKLFKGETELQKDLKIKGVWSKYTEKAKQEMREIRQKIIEKLVELLNATLSLSSPYKVRLIDEHTLTIDVDWDAWQWLNWKSPPVKGYNETAQYKIMEKNMELELKIATKTKMKTYKENEEKTITLAEYQQSIEKLKTSIEELKKTVQLVVEKFQNETITQTTTPTN